MHHTVLNQRVRVGRVCDHVCTCGWTEGQPMCTGYVLSEFLSYLLWLGLQPILAQVLVTSFEKPLSFLQTRYGDVEASLAWPSMLWTEAQEALPSDPF